MAPKGESRESIEAELKADARAQLLAVVQEFKRATIELDNMLMRAESLLGDPVQWRGEPIPNRMRRVGASEDVIAKYERILHWLVAMASGGPKPDDLLKAAEEHRAMRVSVTEQLAQIVQASKSRP
jgi:hypothetical protein